MAFAGWIAGVLGTIALGLAWTIIFPAIVNPEHYYGPGPGLPFLIGLAALAATPGALIGGLIGGRVSIEGGNWSQRILAAIFGIGLSLPCSCYSLWVFTGY
jgi:hypothetical protein